MQAGDPPAGDRSRRADLVLRPRRLRIRRVDPGPSVIRPRGRASRLAISGVTRPHDCPVCLTKDCITRANNGGWSCKTCGYEWGS